MVGNDQTFRQFAETQYQFGWWLRRQRDGARRHPQVSAAQIAFAVIAQVFFGLRSLLRVDQWLRTSLAVAWLRCASTGPRGSDMTLLKALGMWERARLPAGDLCGAFDVARSGIVSPDVEHGPGCAPRLRAGAVDLGQPNPLHDHTAPHLGNIMLLA